MTQEEKELLLKDLCARLPYGVKIVTGGIGKTLESITIKPDYIEIVVKGAYAYSHFIHKDIGEWDNNDDLSRCKPYLRPMSSMTEEERKEFDDFCVIDEFAWEGNFEIGYKNQAIIMSDAIDWLLKKHFDYRGLIPKGLALEAPVDMYKIG